MGLNTRHRVVPPTTAPAGYYAGTDVPHLFTGSTFCRWCFGPRDDVRHWLPRLHQAAEDDLVAKHEDGKRPPPNLPHRRRSPRRRTR